MRQTIILALYLVGGVLPAAAYEQIPATAARYRADLVRSARLAWGMEAPVATFAAQIHQESGWNTLAVSRVGARGLAQFMPATADWMGTLSPDLATRAPENPTWALRALTTYDRWLWNRIQAASQCDRMAMTLSAYNGGLGWVYKDQARTAQAGDNRLLWWGHVEKANAGRRSADFAENRGYPVRILQTLEPRYALWGSRSCP